MMAWTDEQVAVLRRGCADGISYSQIARELGAGCTRNAALGKAHRLGISERSKPSKPVAAPRPAQRPIVVKPPMRAQPPAPIVNVVRTEVCRTVVDEVARLREPCAGSCKWPIGDPRHAGFGYCGASTLKTYCADHDALSRQGAAPRAHVSSARTYSGSGAHQDRPASTVMDRRWS